MTPVFKYLTRGERIWALDRGVVALNTLAKLRAQAESQLGAGMLDAIELNRALDILFQMSVELETSKPSPSQRKRA